MKVLVTGGAGFIGSHTVEMLLKAGLKVVMVDNLSTGKVVNNDAVFYQVDVCSEELGQVFSLEKPDYVIHLAAQVSVQESLIDPLTDGQINILGSINLLNFCVQYDVRKIIFASSAAVYGVPEALPLDERHPTIPESFYGLSKLTIEKYLKLYKKHFDLNYTIFRYANVYGTRKLLSGEGGVVAIFINNLMHNRAPLVYGKGDQTRDFIYVGDVAKANLLALTMGDNETLNISTNTATTVNDLLDQICSNMNKEVEARHTPPKDGDLMTSVLSNVKAKNILKWEPKYSLKEGLKETIKMWNA
jgi:UDP-glucose 4-epimerase